jgi:protein-disulfide isomerase
MKARYGIGAALAAVLALAACGDGEEANVANANTAAPLTQIPAPNNGNWTQVVSQTEEGGFRMGNPDAPVKLVEYASISCHVCQEFAEAATDRLEDVYVASGQVSWEYRPFVLFPSDPGLFMLLRCQGPTPYFRLVEELYEQQPQWMARLQAIPPEQQQQMQGMSREAQAAALVRAADLEGFFRQRGMPQARIDQCLADNQAIVALADQTRRGAEQDGVSGTPSFFINGTRQDVTTWSALEPRLRSAIGG